jgi:hypothetical protein
MLRSQTSPLRQLKQRQRNGVGVFDITTFMLYAEMGLADELIEGLGGRLQSAIDGLLKIVKAPSILLSNKIQPALLSKNDRVRGMQKRLQEAIADVTNDSDASQEKQKLLDAATRIRVDATMRFSPWDGVWIVRVVCQMKHRPPHLASSQCCPTN